MEQQLWRLRDLCGGGLGFTIELFFLAFSQLLSTSPSKESHSDLYTGTFRAITSDWDKHKHSLGAQNTLLDIAISRHREFEVHYPAYIVDEFLSLLVKIFEGQTGLNIDNAVRQFEAFKSYDSRGFRERLLKVLTPWHMRIVHSPVIIPPSPGPPSASRMPAPNSVLSLRSHTSF